MFTLKKYVKSFFFVIPLACERVFRSLYEKLNYNEKVLFDELIKRQKAEINALQKGTVEWLWRFPLNYKLFIFNDGTLRAPPSRNTKQ